MTEAVSDRTIIVGRRGYILLMGVNRVAKRNGTPEMLRELGCSIYAAGE